SISHEGTKARSKQATTAFAKFVYDAVRTQLSYDVHVLGAAPDSVYAVTQRRADGARTGPVYERLSGPGVMSASGTLQLSGDVRDLLIDGRLLLSVFTRDAPAGEVQARLTLPTRDARPVRAVSLT